MVCKICETRKPKRCCPGVQGDICPQCCGNEREATVDCPFDCEYLRAAREHYRPPEVNPDQFPNKEIRITEEFLAKNQHTLYFAGKAMLEAALGTPGAVDFDVREALDTLVRTYRTLESGLYYESRPSSPAAGVIHSQMQQRFQEYRQRIDQNAGMTVVRDAEILGILAFLQRLEIQHNNTRRRGRAFIDFLRGYFAQGEVQAEASSLIRP